MSEVWIPGTAEVTPTRRGLLSWGVVAGAMALLGSAGDPAEAAETTGSDGMPLIHTRSEWGARSPKYRIQVLGRGPDHIVVHHTSTPNTTDLSLAHACALSRQIQRFHMDSRGWNDIGEQLTISRGGYVMEGRHGSLKAILARRNVLGAQTQSHNQHTLGIENEGDYMTTPVPERLWSSLTDVCVWLCRTYQLDPYRAIVGHRDYNSTDCPGNVLYGRLPELRRLVTSRLSRPVPPDAAHDPMPTLPAPDPWMSPTEDPRSLSRGSGAD